MKILQQTLLCPLLLWLLYTRQENISWDWYYTWKNFFLFGFSVMKTEHNSKSEQTRRKHSACQWGMEGWRQAVRGASCQPGPWGFLWWHLTSDALPWLAVSGAMSYPRISQLKHNHLQINSQFYSPTWDSMKISVFSLWKHKAHSLLTCQKLHR